MIKHTLMALALQSGLYFALGDMLIGAAAGSLAFLMREITQAEYRWIEQFGDGKRANMPLLGGLDKRVWTFKSLLDWIVPAIVVFGVFGYVRFMDGDIVGLIVGFIK